jgi:signal transduction histidine kinase
MDLFRRALQGETLPLFETRVLTKAGKCATVEITTTPQIHQGKVVAVLGIARDITERKQLEAQYRQAQKMEAVGRLAGGVTHDFNNLLTIITGYSELLLGSQDVPASAHGLIREIQRSGERAAALTRQLLAFSRKQVLTPTVLDLNVVVTGLEKMLHRLIGEDINLTIRLDPALVRIKADPGQLEQVIMNLVVNARDAMPSGGNLTIETRNAELTEAQARARPGLGKGLHALLVVADTGCGMDEETRAHLFEPFFTTKGPGKGTGLGLATVFGIVQQSSGHIEVESQVARGSTFLIYLPGVEEACPSPRSEPSLLPIRGGTQTVLLAEDDDGVRLLARLALQSHGYTVLEARNGQEALTLCHEHQGSVHLLITDVVMPLMSGRELADRLKSRRPDIRVLYLSGYTGDTVLHHGVLETGLAFLQKPFTPAALARKVRDLLDQPESARR